MRSLILYMALAPLMTTLAITPRGAAGDEVRFQRAVRPILASKCFTCHGPDEAARQAELRLDEKAVIDAVREGRRIITPGSPAQSELARRITAVVDGERMPPPDSGLALTAAEIETLTQWIEQGAPWEEHWSLTPIVRPVMPNDVSPAEFAAHPIDRFVRARLAREGLSPSPPAERTTVLRRLSLDLIGLPPSPVDVEAFLADVLPGAYERAVDRLLASPHGGERLALDWLDGARFADSGGYQGDIFRTMWPWRDGVIAAFNRNQPFDQFTVEQLAGDLLPHPTREQLIASGFNRNHRINDEDGIILEEFRVEYVVDRVETTATVWMGLTLGCARCHDHKYDPFSQREFYQFFAYFNSIAEEGRGHGNAPPILRLTTPEQDRQTAELNQKVAELQGELSSLGDGSDNAPRRDELSKAIAAKTQEREAIVGSAPVTMIQQELPTPPETFVLMRGAYDKPGEKVLLGAPQVLPPLPADAPANRLGMARWLVDGRHPLTARVIVNRYWQMLFGVGLVATPEDFGVQGEAPSHPELLDWLASEFMASGWDVKRLLRLIVTSETYRQSSQGTAESFARDPGNRWLSRGPRFRLPAEMLRDQALAVAGLLDERIGGPPVRPYQPEGLWKDLASAGDVYDQSHGGDLLRRGMYTFWRRTVPHPAMAAFDAPSREVCSVRRARTNTPVQSLVLLNDPTFVEAARGLAQRVLHEAKTEDDAGKLRTMFRLAAVREIRPSEEDVLLETLRHFSVRFANDPASAAALVAVGESKPPSDLAANEEATSALAAWTVVATTILNLDEIVTKE